MSSMKGLEKISDFPQVKKNIFCIKFEIKSISGKNLSV